MKFKKRNDISSAISSTKEQKNNAYALDDDEDWTFDEQMIEEGEEDLNKSIEQHTIDLHDDEDLNNLEDEEFQDEDDNNSKVSNYNDVYNDVQSDSSVSFATSARSFGYAAGMSESVTDDDPPFKASKKRGAFSRVKKKVRKSILKRKKKKKNNNDDDQTLGSNMSGSNMSSDSYNSVAAPALTFTKQTKMGTKIRAGIFLVSLILSTILALMVGHNSIGRCFANYLLRTYRHSSDEEIGRLPTANGLGTINSTKFEIPDLESMNIILPPRIDKLYADWRVPFPATNRSDLPTFWQIPKGGFSVVQRILSQCLNLAEVSKLGANHWETDLRIHETKEGMRYVNVDPTTVTGLQRGFELGLVPSGFAEVMFTPLIIEATTLFQVGYHGRFFTLFRHPSERAMGLYYAAKKSDPVVMMDMSVSEFARTRLPNNEMVRTLSSKTADEDVTRDDLYLAMEILRRKCVVGLVSSLSDSMYRFYDTFGWHLMVDENVKMCQAQLLQPGKNAASLFLPKGEALMEIERQNSMDLKLYQYALHLYDLQGGDDGQSATSR
mmetsp:Transcript_7704/g.8789  ORF Transcript_7704/g.8789 Transcript_7704/m.8789 type:complete len:551 (+) Transcript_7704:192-1844(+)